MNTANSTSLHTLDSVFETSWKSWIPGNVEVIQEILRKIDLGRYKGNPKDVFNDLQQDIGSYLYVIRELSSQKHMTEGHPQLSQSDEVTRLKRAIEGALQKVCSKPNSQRLQNALPFQLEILRECYITSTTVELLLDKISPQERLAETVSLLRSLGRILLAWNYPKEFSHAVDIVKSSQESVSLDTVLSNFFRFAPSTLGAKIALEIGFNKEVLALIEPNGRYTSSQESEMAKKITSVCEMAECFAYANGSLPNTFSETKILESVQFIESTLGQKGIETLFNKVNHLCTNYRRLFPESFPVDGVNIGSLTLYDDVLLNKLARRAGIKNLEDAKTILERKCSRTELFQAVSNLFMKVLPLHGIEASAVLVLSPVERSLLPIFKKGSATFIKVAETSLLYSDGIKSNSVRDVYLNKTTEQIQGHDNRGELLNAYLQVINKKSPLGVLYLEAREKDVSPGRLRGISELIEFLLNRLYSK